MPNIMIQGKPFPTIDENYTFTFTCKYDICNKCCSAKNLELSPYDIFRICQQQNMTTIDLHNQYTKFTLNPKINIPRCLLKTDPICKFNKQGKTCMIYENRPLVCRLYPIGLTFRENKLQFVHQKGCVGHESTEQHTLQSWLQKEGSDAQINFEQQWSIFRQSEALAKRKQELPRFPEIFVFLFFNFDHPNVKMFLQEHNINHADFSTLYAFLEKALLTFDKEKLLKLLS